MHTQVKEYVYCQTHGTHFDRVVEFGSRDINGTVRSFIDCNEYVGIDLYPGPGVDVVGDAALYWDEPSDLVLCLEVLEHAPNWSDLIDSAAKNLKSSGTFIITCATDPRAPHSTHDGGEVRPDEYYENVDPDVLWNYISDQFIGLDIIVSRTRGDLYVTAVRK